VKPADLVDRIAHSEAALARRPAAFPTVLATSSQDGKGISELRAAIARLLAERKS
jgi:GTP-binding protein